MIPVKLQMHNFLSYGENVPPLDFTQFNIACLSGKNGQGKSALLDALTWAIWGEGRKASQDRKADSGLLKIGENQMWVDLTIDLEGDRYRIIRKFSNFHNKHHSELELQVFDGKKSSFVSLSSPSIRETQNRIGRLLRMDYNTFINSAFILQGRVDEFTRKSASDRKQILSEVLGLSHYEELSLLARKYLRVTETELLNIKNRLEQSNKEVSQKENIKEEIKVIQKNENNINSKLKEIREKIQFFEKKKNRLSFDKERGKELKNRIISEKEELHALERKKCFLKEKIRDYQIILSRKEKILSDYKQYQYLYDKNQNMFNLMQEFRKLDKLRGEIEQKIEKTKSTFLLELKQKKQRYSELREKVNLALKVKEEVENLKSKAKQCDILSKKQEHIQQEGNQLNVEIESKKNNVERIGNEIKQNYEKIDLLIQSKQKYCPLCESPLDDDRRLIIRQNIDKDISGKEHEIKVLTKEIEQLSNRKSVLQDKWKENKHYLKQVDEIKNKIATLSFMLKEGKNTKKQLQVLTEEIKTLEEKIKGKLFALNERKELEDVKNKIQEQGYDDSKYVMVNQELEKLKKAPLYMEKLSEGQKSILDLTKEQKEIENQLESGKKAINNLESHYMKIIKALDELPKYEKMLQCHQKLLFHLQIYHTRLFEKKGAYQEKIEKIIDLQKEAKRYEGKRVHYLRQKEIYKKLAVAFGKNGVQSMIIENAIPELEDEANEILAQLSNEKTTISLESLKELKSGDLRETLDIKIHDDVGIRPYELYSGGETFRIDFAIRISLSKLLAYRAGARLKTLVIDEGFGTQDEDGLEKLIQAIHAIQNDFEKILVITHLPLLKDAFPVRIEVWKDPALGSQFDLIHL
ncbi:MAG: SMC family ATPase [Atribacterota bacterium]|nr:SMC family ATPase [Atribacterota bacterium]